MAGIAAEMTLPGVVAQDEHPVPPGHGMLGRESVAQHRPHPHRLEEVRRDDGAGHPHRVAVRGEGHRALGERRDLLERARLLAPVLEVGGGDGM